MNFQNFFHKSLNNENFDGYIQARNCSSLRIFRITSTERQQIARDRITLMGSCKNKKKILWIKYSFFRKHREYIMNLTILSVFFVIIVMKTVPGNLKKL